MVLSINVALQCLLVVAHAVKHLRKISEGSSRLEAATEHISDLKTGPQLHHTHGCNTAMRLPQQ